MKVLKNYMEVLVWEVIDEILSTTDLDICKCVNCRLDIAAKALNNLPPRYYVSEKGEVFSKLNMTHLDARTEVVTEVTKAVMHIVKSPRHCLKG